MDSIEKLLKNLTESQGVSGFEAPVAKVVEDYFKPLGELSKDKLGSIICRKSGESESPRIMLAGHMDEIGFVVQHISENGFIHFLPLGGWFDQVLLGQRVAIKTRKGDVMGVFGVKPPHLIPAEERTKVIKMNEMYIDIGATCKEELIDAGVRVGDPIIPMASFEILSNGKSYLAKALDDRVGVALMISVLKKLQEQTHPNTVYAAATVMEEFNLGGAKTSAELIQPDLAIVLESGLAGDVPGLKPEESNFKLGKGPGILLYDARMVPNLKLRDLIMDVAAARDIPVQTVLMNGGTTDGAAIHLHKSGVPAIVLAVAARHIHSHNAIMYRDDYDLTVNLLTSVISELDEKTVSRLTN